MDMLDTSAPMLASDVLSPDQLALLNGTRTTKTYAVPVPESLKGFVTPKDINQFITGLLPNLTVFAKARLGSRILSSRPDAPSELVNNFVLYMLSETTEGEVRYTRYDPVNFPGQPYYKWFLMNFSYFCMEYTGRYIKDSSRFVSIVPSYEEYTEKTANTMSMDELASAMEGDEERHHSIDYIYAEQVLTRVHAYSESARSRFSPGKKCFETHADRLLEARIMGYTNPEIAQQFGISTQGVNQWVAKLRELLGNMFDTGTVELAAV